MSSVEYAAAFITLRFCVKSMTETPLLSQNMVTVTLPVDFTICLPLRGPRVFPFHAGPFCP
jgi:hypothetical protein